MAKIKSVYVCQNCGAQRARWEGKCSDCGEWNSFVEEVTEKNQRGWTPAGSTKLNVADLTLDQVQNELMNRLPTSLTELDRVLGGGLVPGSFILVGGDPGIGKSTLLLQLAGGLAKLTKRTFYVSAEESVAQTQLRARRLGVHSSHIRVASESELDLILDTIRSERPDVVVIDSIQTVFLRELSSSPGSVSQVRECAGKLLHLAKQDGVCVILVGHVTKEGQIAGPKVLEHMVDTVLSFEGDSSYQFRLLRSEKNRFGAAHELGVFRMSSQGLVEVHNPSEMFLAERQDKTSGSAVLATIEGTRTLLCEVQALVHSTPQPMPRRTVVGMDVNRVHMLLAVIQNHLRIDCSQHDVFVNVVGGLRLMEPAADLATLAAILSSRMHFDLGSDQVFFGEIGLTGEIRAVSFAEERIKEARKLGFQRVYLPNANRKALAIDTDSPTQLFWLKNVSDLMKQLPAAKSSHGRQQKTAVKSERDQWPDATV